MKIFYDKPIYYIGFYKNKKLKEIEINSDISRSLNGNNIEEAKEINMKDINGINGQSHSSEENTRTEEKNKINSDINEEESAKNKTEEENEIKNENNNINICINQSKDNSTCTNMDFSSLKDLPARIAIFKLEDRIFGEKLIYEKEELNLLGTLRDDSNIMKKDLTNIKEKIDIMDERMDTFETLLKAMAEKLGIDSNKILNEKKLKNDRY